MVARRRFGHRPHRRQSAAGRREGGAGGRRRARSVPPQLSARARAQRGRAVGAGRGGVREGHCHRPGACLRALFRRSRVLPLQTARSDGDAPRVFPEARTECPRTGSGRRPHADAARPIEKGTGTFFARPDEKGSRPLSESLCAR